MSDTLEAIAVRAGTLHDEEEVLAELRARIADAGTQRQWAEQQGLSAGYVSGLLHRRRSITADFAFALGFQKLTVFARSEDFLS